MRKGLPFCKKCGKRLSRKDAKVCAECRDYSGNLNPMFGKKRPDVVLRNKQMDVRGENNPMFGKVGCWANKKRPDISKRMKGQNNPMYGVRLRGKECGVGGYNGRSSLCNMIRSLQEFTQYRLLVFERDNYTCQDCGHKGGWIENHHKKPFKVLLDEFLAEYNQFSPIEDKETLVRLAMKWEPFWDIDNGETLCRKCHEKTFAFTTESDL